jgi:hypothetical protein
MLRRTVGLLGVVLACACRPTNRTDPTEARHAIDSLNSKLVAWYSAGQADSAAEIFGHDVWAMPPNSMPIVGRDSLRSYQKNVFAAGKWDFDLKTDDVASADSLGRGPIISASAIATPRPPWRQPHPRSDRGR